MVECAVNTNGNSNNKKSSFFLSHQQLATELK